jgi:ferredoxin
MKGDFIILFFVIAVVIGDKNLTSNFLNLNSTSYLCNMSDVNITIIDREGVSHTIPAPTDMAMSLMEIVRAYELAPEGTIGICGGMAMCASCQCYVLSENVPIPEMLPDEEAMLDEAYNVKPNSRLGCQIPVTESLEGLIVELAPEA